jgi:hypothetical protein
MEYPSYYYSADQVRAHEDAHRQMTVADQKADLQRLFNNEMTRVAKLIETNNELRSVITTQEKIIKEL